jgi:hypothetical protein
MKQDIPWLTPEIKRLIRKRERIYKKLKSTRVEERPNIIKKHREICDLAILACLAHKCVIVLMVWVL